MRLAALSSSGALAPACPARRLPGHSRAPASAAPSSRATLPCTTPSRRSVWRWIEGPALHEGALAQGAGDASRRSLPARCNTVVAVGGGGIRDVDAHCRSRTRGAVRPVAHDTTSEPRRRSFRCLRGGRGGRTRSSCRVGVGEQDRGSQRHVGGAVWGEGVRCRRGTSAMRRRSRRGRAESSRPARSGDGVRHHASRREQQHGLLRPQRREGGGLRARRAAAPACEHRGGRPLRRGPLRAQGRLRGGGGRGRVQRRRAQRGAQRVAHPAGARAGEVLRLRGRLQRGVGTLQADRVEGVDVVRRLGDACQGARALVPGATVSASTEGRANDAEASCGGGAEGADVPWRFELGSRLAQILQLVECSSDVSPVLHVRRACDDALSEVACGESGVASNEAAVTGVFDPGGYTVFADARQRESAGSYALSLETARVEGGGAVGDGCGDAMALGGASGTVTGDTFTASDELAGTCGGAGAADVVYRIDVPHRGRLRASLGAEEGRHVLVAWHRCGERRQALACRTRRRRIELHGLDDRRRRRRDPDALGRFLRAQRGRRWTWGRGRRRAPRRLRSWRSARRSGRLREVQTTSRRPAAPPTWPAAR